jgi:shikimate kinase
VLVVVIGPIASGKSTVCRLLARRLVAAGRTVAAIDLDDVAAMVSAPGGRTPTHWDQAHRVHGSLVGAWLETSVDVVLAHGPFYSRDETDALTARLPPRTALVRVLLLAPFDLALRRVADDPERGLSRDPAFLRAAYERFSTLRPAMDPCDLTLDTASLSAEVIAARIADRMLPVSGPDGPISV